jgi:diaminohydroxyphosphoribosylaminopyrimidine deaminase/5-amino-6-(5-phosphoribosylamino)uracil reductase
LKAGLVDEWLVYLAPMLLGPDARPLAALPPITRIAAARRFELYELKQIGPDIRLRLRGAS